MLTLTIQGVPQPKQSFRFTLKGIRYKDKKVVLHEQSIRAQVEQQIPSDFKMLDGPLGSYVNYVFPIPASFSKKKKKLVEDGAIYFKISTPDLMDNLNKGVFDAIKKRVITDDSRICVFGNSKIYGLEPMAEVTIYQLPDYIISPEKDIKKISFLDYAIY